jgi:hypothetical protein
MRGLRFAAAALVVTLGGGTGQALAQEPVPAAPAPQPAASPAPEITARIAAFRIQGRVTLGERTAIAGRVAPAAPTRVVIERLDGARWVPIATLRSTARGVFRADLPIRRSASLRARPAPAAGAGEPGPRRNVSVRRRIALSVAVQEHEPIAGRPFVARGVVAPSRDGEFAVLEGSRDGAPFRPLARMRVRDGRVSGAFTPSAGGAWRFRLSAPPVSRGEADSVSEATPRRAVFPANPHGVPSSSSHYIVQVLSEMQIYYYESGQLLRVLPVVFGKPSTPTPLGTYRVYSKTPGPRAAFGPHVLWYHRGYGIHGTNQEHLLSRSWRYYSLGCTRNYNANIRWLYPRVPVGTPVRNIR